MDAPALSRAATGGATTPAANIFGSWPPVHTESNRFALATLFFFSSSSSFQLSRMSVFV
jgi:hypothetical protein